MRVAVVVLAALLAGAPPAAAQGLLDTLSKKVLGESGAAAPSAASALTSDQIIQGLKEALRVGVDSVVGQLGAAGGFSADPQVRVPLPRGLRDVRGLLAGLGMSGQLDDLEARMNRAAELATPRAKDLFLNAISEMTLDDARTIYDGPEDAATRYFADRMTPDLKTAMRPIVDDTLAEVAAVRLYQGVAQQVKALPMAPNLNLDLTDHVLDEALEGIFHYLAREEAAIRSDPAKRVTEILQRTFGGN